MDVAATTTTRTVVLVVLLVTLMRMSSSSTSFSSAAIVATTTAITATTHRTRTMSSFVASSSLSSSFTPRGRRQSWRRGCVQDNTTNRRGRESPARTITAHAVVASSWESVPSSFSSSSSLFASSLRPPTRNRRYRHHNRHPGSSFSSFSSSSSSSETDEPTGDKDKSVSASSEGGGRVPEKNSIRRTLAKTPTHLAFEDSSSSNGSANAAPAAAAAPAPDPFVYEWEQTIKKSRFIALARSVTDWSDATAFLHHIHTHRHPKARHWCYAYRGTITERASDDGEPSGTAGQPILNALQTEGDLMDVMLIVIRYSGGIKLGAGTWLTCGSISGNTHVCVCVYIY